MNINVLCSSLFVTFSFFFFFWGSKTNLGFLLWKSALFTYFSCSKIVSFNKVIKGCNSGLDYLWNHLHVCVFVLCLHGKLTQTGLACSLCGLIPASLRAEACMLASATAIKMASFLLSRTRYQECVNHMKADFRKI